MESALGRQELEREMSRVPARDQILHIDLKGRDPDDGVTSVPYEKGALLLRSLEQAFGRDRFDKFLREYFDHFSFQSITTATFVDYLKQHLPGAQDKAPLEEWLNKPGLPESAPRPVSDAFTKVAEQARRFAGGEISAAKIRTGGWSTHEWLHFLESLPQQMTAGQMLELDKAFSLTRSGNSEILQQWLLIAVRNQYEPASARLEEFLTSVGRRKYLKPLYTELVKTPAGRVRAREIYRKARPGYHPIAVTTIDGIVK
jgi:leukotriene-A4 hydrolase